MQSVTAPRHLTLRNVPPEVAQSLQKEARRRGSSLNQTAVDLLRVGLGVATPRSNGLKRLAGSWTQEDLDRFQAGVASTEAIDEEMWR
jgi:plasmid stability protein